MGLFEFFFPDESTAISIKRLADNQSKMIRKQNRNNRSIKLKTKKQATQKSDLKDRIEELENDLGFLALIVASIMNRLDENQLVKREDIKEIMKEIDGIDGEVDGKLNINVLRGVSS